MATTIEKELKALGDELDELKARVKRLEEAEVNAKARDGSGYWKDPEVDERPLDPGQPSEKGARG